MAEAGTRVVFPVHREEVRALDRGVQQVIAGCGLEKHMAIVGYLKSEHGMGHGHANGRSQAMSPVLKLSTQAFLRTSEWAIAGWTAVS